MTLLINPVYLYDRSFQRKVSDSSRYGERVSQLLANPELGEQMITNYRPDEHFVSNCYGTTLWIIGTDRRFRPHFAERKKMEKFLSECRRIDSPITDSIIAFKVDKILWHTALFLGNFDGNNILLHQPATGMEFGLAFLDEYVQEHDLSGMDFHVYER